MAKVQTNGNGKIYLNQSNQVLLGNDMSDDTVVATGSTEPRTLANRFADVINVKDFGAVGDGVTDDTNAIQAAINSSHHANTGIKDIIFFPAGKYKVTTITISNGQSVILSNPNLISESIAIIINNGCEGTIIEYGKITAKDCGIWVQRGKAVHIEHTRIDITHEYANSTEVYGIRFGGVQDLYAGNENIILDCSIYSKHYVNGYGLYQQSEDNMVSGLFIKDFKYGIRDSGGSNFYDRVHGWNYGYTEGTDQEFIDSLRGGALFYSYRDITIQSCYADSYQYAIFCTDSSGQYQHKIDGLLVFHGTSWPSSLKIFIFRNGQAYYKNSWQVSHLDVNNTSSAEQYYCDTGATYINGFYDNNAQNSNVGGMPYLADSLNQDVGIGSANEARLYAVKEDRKTQTGYMGFGSWSTGAYYWLLHLFPSDNFSSAELQYQVSANGGQLITQHIRPSDDNNRLLGTSSYRWREIFCANATINTSDERQKQNIEDIDEAVFRAWSKVNFIQYKFKDVVEQKGENARIHFGVIAQRVKEAFESEGLDGFKYGLLCYDEWEDEYEDVEVIDKEAEYDEDGNEIVPAKTHTEKKLIQKAGNAYGIRYAEALALECAYQRHELKQLKAQLNK